METVFIEATSDAGNFGKFMVGRFTEEEWLRQSFVDHVSLLGGRGWSPRHVLVLDLATGEGAMFSPGGFAEADLEKHAVWVCPLFQPFLEWLYRQDLRELAELPCLVELTGVPLQLSGYRRAGPFERAADCWYDPRAQTPYRAVKGADPFNPEDQALYLGPT